MKKDLATTASNLMYNLKYGDLDLIHGTPSIKKIPTLEELNPGIKKEEASFEDLIKVSGADLMKYNEFKKYEKDTKSRNEKTASIAKNILRVAANNIMQIDELREKKCEEIWAKNVRGSHLRLIKMDFDITLLRYDERYNMITPCNIKKGDYINITNPLKIYPINEEKLSKEYTVVNENGSKILTETLLKEAEKVHKEINKKENKIEKENDMSEKKKEKEEEKKVEELPIDSTSKKETSKEEMALPATTKTPKEIYQPVYDLINKVLVTDNVEEKARLRQFLYETKERVAEELKAYDLGLGLNDIQRELDPKVYEQIRLNTAKELEEALEKGDLRKVDLIDLTPEQREAALKCQNLDKAYNVPVGLVKEWYDRQGMEYPESFKTILDNIQSGKIKPPQEADKNATIKRSAYEEFQKVEREIDALRENEKNPAALGRIEVTMRNAGKEVMRTFESWEKERTQENTNDLIRDEKEHDELER